MRASKNFGRFVATARINTGTTCQDHEDDDGVDDDQYGDGDLHLHLITSNHRTCKNPSSVSTLPNELEDAVFFF